MENNETKLNWRETFRGTIRALVIWWKINPKLIISSLCSMIFNGCSPYVTAFLAAQVLNELAGNRDPQILWRWVAITVVTIAVVKFAADCFKRWYWFEKDTFQMQYRKLFMDKMLDMDFSVLDRAETVKLLIESQQYKSWSGWGLTLVINRIYWSGLTFVEIISGIGLSVSLFTSQVPADAANLLFLNHPLCIIAVLAAMAASTWLSGRFEMKATEFWTKLDDEGQKGQRFFSFFGNDMAVQKERAVDLRMFEQQTICDYYMGKQNALGFNSKLATMARGPMGAYGAAGTAAAFLLTGIAYLFVCLKAWGGAFGIGSVTQYITALTGFFVGISELTQDLGIFRVNAWYLQTTYEFLDIPNEMYQGSLPTEKRADREYDVEFRDVSFKYPDNDIWALRHVNMKFKVGSRLAVVGMNGSGKTTFIKLLCRLYDPTEGQILLNGIDIRKYDYRDYLNVFSVVFQDFQLLALPLGQNVAAKADYDRSRAEECLRKAGFGDRLDSLPKGLDTYLYKDLNNEGIDVSGGEAQKIAIARALYKDAPFIILDEPTAALDPIAEAEIYSKFNDISGDKTAIYISHRLSSCKFCDEIAVFHEGQVIQQGTHEGLLADENGKYYELWHAQAQYYTEQPA